MKSTERLAAIVLAIIAVGGAVQAALLLPYRIDQAEKAHKDLAVEVASEKLKSDLVRESLIRIEERVKGVQVTVDEMDRRQRFSASK